LYNIDKSSNFYFLQLEKGAGCCTSVFHYKKHWIYINPQPMQKTIEWSQNIETVT